tara:strand:+ start:1933 stop:2403 length:471 start_codon:yes stop_codon:yes gene_type:complete
MAGEIPTYMVNWRLQLSSDFSDASLPTDLANVYTLVQDRGQLPSTSTTYYQDVGIYAGEFEADANTRAVRCQYNVTFYRKLDTPLLNEKIWMGGFLYYTPKLYLLMEKLCDPDWWRTVNSATGVYDIESDPVASNPQRNGNIMSIDVSCGLLLVGL